jgi:hypothetical protein
MKTLLFGIAILSFCSNCVAQDLGNLIVAHPIDTKELRNAAAVSLKGYVVDFLNKENVQRFGFSSLDEARISTIGDPMQVLMIGLTDIQKFEQGSNPKSILTDINTFWFPVVSGNTIKTKLEMIEREGKIVTGELGGVRLVSDIMNSIEDLQKRLKERSLIPTKQVAIVKIPALTITLVMAEVGDSLYVEPAYGLLEQYGIKHGELIKLEEALLRIKVVAVKVDPKKTM